MNQAHEITRRAWRLPWQGEAVPHALLDVLRGCNITCRACYNTAAPRLKSFEQVSAEFAQLCKLRRLDSVSIVGGEPALHPDLCRIVRLIRAAGVSVEIFTNGLKLDPPFLAQLKEAGVNLVFLHIDAQQTRPDLPAPDAASLRTLRAQKAAALTAAGLEAGLAVTAYPDALEEIEAAVELVLTSPDLDYLLVTLCRDTPALGMLGGHLSDVIRQVPCTTSSVAPAAVAAPAVLTNAQVYARLKERFGLAPFAFIGSNVDPDDPRWLSYLAGTVVGTGPTPHPPYWRAISPSAIEPLFLRLFHYLKGRYPFYMPQSPGRFRLQLVLNALTGLHLSNLTLLARRGRLRTKRLLFQAPAELSPDGRLVHCAHCPDATLREGRLVPVCVSDQMAREGKGH